MKFKVQNSKFKDVLNYLIIFFFLIFPFYLSQSAFAATRFYLPSSGTAEVSPAFAGFNEFITADRILMLTTKQSTAMTNQTVTNGNFAANRSLLNRQYVSNPIAGQVISGTVSGQVRGKESNGGADMVSAVRISVVSNNGGVQRGILLGLTYEALSGNEYTTTITNRMTPLSQTLSSVTAQNGDRIVVEIGCFAYSQSSRILTQVFGDDNASDLPVDQTTTTANNPWIEFSQDIIFPSSGLIREGD